MPGPGWVVEAYGEPGLPAVKEQVEQALAGEI